MKSDAHENARMAVKPGMHVVGKLFGKPTRVEHDLGDGWLIEVTPPANLGLPTVEVKLTDDQFVRYTHWLAYGGQIQHLLADLSPEDREALLNGTR